MPLYEYRNCITGKIEELFRRIADRDDVPPHLKRITVPSRVSTPMGFPDPVGVNVAGRAAFRSIEEHGESQTFDRYRAEHGWSARQLEKIWRPENNPPEEYTPEAGTPLNV